VTQIVSLATLVLTLIALPAVARAQWLPAGVSAGWYVIPSFSLTGEYDSNILGSSSGEIDDVIAVFTPGIAFGYQSAPLSIWGRYAFGAEVFADNSDLNGINRHRAALEFRYLPDPRLTLRFTATYDQSESPTTLLQPVDIPEPTAPVAGEPVPPGTPLPPPTLEFGRRTTKQYVVSPSMSYKLTPGTTISSGYTYARSDVEGSPTDESHTARVSVSRELTRLDSVSASYIFRYFSEEGETAEDDSPTSSHSILLGYRRTLTELTEASIEAGPRIDDNGDVSAEVRAGLTHRFTPTIRGDLRYSRSQDIVSGRTGAQTIDTVAASLGWQALRELNVSLAPRFSYVSAESDPSGDTRVYSVVLRAVYRLTEWLSARAEYNFVYQDEEVGGDIVRHVFSLSLDLAYPIRVH
jgi:hypothetical protein